jgi:hypothetical protein
MNAPISSKALYCPTAMGCSLGGTSILLSVAKPLIRSGASFQEIIAYAYAGANLIDFAELAFDPAEVDGRP